MCATGGIAATVLVASLAFQMISVLIPWYLLRHLPCNWGTPTSISSSSSGICSSCSWQVGVDAEVFFTECAYACQISSTTQGLSLLAFGKMSKSGTVSGASSGAKSSHKEFPPVHRAHCTVITAELPTHFLRCFLCSLQVKGWRSCGFIFFQPIVR